MLLPERLKECKFKTFHLLKVSSLNRLNLFPEKSSISIPLSNLHSPVLLIPSIFICLHMATALFKHSHSTGHFISSAFVWCTGKYQNTNAITVDIIPNYDSSHLRTDNVSLLRWFCHPLYHTLSATHFAVR